MSGGNVWDEAETGKVTQQGDRHYEAGKEVLPQVPRKPLRWSKR